MDDSLVPAPWNVIETDPFDRRFMLVHNTFSRKTYRMKRRAVGEPLGSKANDAMRRFLASELMLIEPDRIGSMLDNRLNVVMHGFPNNSATATLLPTYDCQLRCVYCYNEPIRENDKKKPKSPPEKIAKKLIDYYRNTPVQYWRLVVTGGGEPFLAADYLAKIAKMVQEAAWDDGREFSISIIGNGQAMTPAKVKRLVKVGLNSVVITLDPDHDATRPLKNGGPTFDTIINNLTAAPPEVSISINVNMHPGEETILPGLLGKLAPLRTRLAQVKATIISPPLPQGPVTLGELPPYSRQFGPKETDTYIAAVDLIDDAGFRRKGIFPAIGCESFTAAERMVLNFAGEETFCAALDNLPAYRTDRKKKKELDRFELRIAHPQWKEFCMKEGMPCPYLTVCWGGCRVGAVFEGRDWSVINCEFEYFDRMTRHILKTWSA